MHLSVMREVFFIYLFVSIGLLFFFFFFLFSFFLFSFFKCFFIFFIYLSLNCLYISRKTQPQKKPLRHADEDRSQTYRTLNRLFISLRPSGCDNLFDMQAAPSGVTKTGVLFYTTSKPDQQVV